MTAPNGNRDSGSEPPGPTEIAMSAQLVAQADRIEWCTHCGRCVAEVNEHDECVLCVDRMASADYRRVESTIALLGAILEEASHYLARDDVIELAHKKLGDGGRVADWRQRENDEHLGREAEIKCHNAEVKRLRALSGKEA